MKYAIMMQKVVDVAGIFSWEVTMVKLIKGESDLATLHPDLVKEWHPIKNGDLMPGTSHLDQVRKFGGYAQKGTLTQW